MYSLITTVFNEENSIIEFVRSLNDQTIYPDELIIVDGGSNDNTVQLLKENICPGIHFRLIIDETCSKKHSKGPIARGRNVAIQKTKYKNILVTDAGCVLDQNWVKQMIFSFENKKADVVSGWYKAKVTNDFQKEISTIFCPPLENLNTETFLPSSRSLGFKKELWEKVKGYPEDSYTAEDTLFDLKIFKIAKNIVFNEKAFVYWNIPEDKKELKQKLYQYGYGEGQQKIFLTKNFLKILLLIFFPILILAVLLGFKNIRVFTFYYYFSKGFLSGLFK